MCGRYAFFSPAAAVRRLFALEAVPELEPRYNIAPTQAVAAVRAPAGTRELVLLHWGLVPRWARERAIGNRMINARAETLAEKPAFRDAFRRRRCLVVADGWYEWQAAPDGRQPWFIRARDRDPIAFAGLWERWTDPADGQPLESCALVTTDATAALRRIHDRMPVVLPPEHWPRWLDAGCTDVAALGALLGPGDDARFEAWPVSRAVNSPRHEGAALIERAGGPEPG